MASDILPIDESVPARERSLLVLSAAGEIEALADVLVYQAHEFATPGDMIARGLGMRLRQLAKVQLSALGDEHDPVREIRRRLEGRLRWDESHV